VRNELRSTYLPSYRCAGALLAKVPHCKVGLSYLTYWLIRLCGLWTGGLMYWSHGMNRRNGNGFFVRWAESADPM